MISLNIFFNIKKIVLHSVSPNSISGLNNRNSGTREVHNKLEKNRRAHLKECFELLKSHLPSFEDRKISNLAILRSSLRHIQVSRLYIVIHVYKKGEKFFSLFLTMPERQIEYIVF